MTQSKNKTLILFWGWTTQDHSYRGLVNSAPSNWQVFPINYQQASPYGSKNNFYQYILEFLKAHNLSKANFGGHSLGGALALDFAYHHPEKVEHLYLIDSAGIRDKQDSLLNSVRFSIATDPNHKKTSIKPENVILRSLKNPIHHLRLGILAYFFNLENEASKLSVPTTILWGEEDRLIPIKKGVRLHQLISGSKFIVLKEAGMSHDWIKFYPEKFWELV